MGKEEQEKDTGQYTACENQRADSGWNPVSLFGGKWDNSKGLLANSYQVVVGFLKGIHIYLHMLYNPFRDSLNGSYKERSVVLFAFHMHN